MSKSYPTPETAISSCAPSRLRGLPCSAPRLIGE